MIREKQIRIVRAPYERVRLLDWIPFVRNDIPHPRVESSDSCSSFPLHAVQVWDFHRFVSVEIETLTDSNFNGLVKDGKDAVWVIEFYASVRRLWLVIMHSGVHSAISLFPRGTILPPPLFQPFGSVKWTLWSSAA